VLGLHELSVEDIMVPRADVIAVGLHMTLGEVLDVFRDAGHSRLPVHGDTLDDPRGMVHIRDFVEILVAGTPAYGQPKGDAAPAGAVTLATPLENGDLIRPVLFVPPSMQALDLLRKMQASRTHMALVIDEYGGTDGLVTIEDIVEVIVGDIEDEHDEEEAPLIDAEAGGTFLADGRAALDDVSAMVGVDLTVGDDAEEIDTIGGLVTALCGHVPTRGEVVTEHADFDFEVLDADPRRVKRLRIRPREEAVPADGAVAVAPAGSGETAAARSPAG
jgi:CBS domain containing-hemolysin-like protein